MGIREFSSAHIPPIVVVGANHTTLSIAGREVFSAFGNAAADVQNIARAAGTATLAVLSTCNRFECVTCTEDGGEQLVDHLLGATGGAVHRSDLFVLSDTAAVQHLFRVTSSLDSMVLGEAQILGQVKDSYRTAIQAGTVNKILHHLFQYGFRVAKQVRTQTAVSEKGVSVSYVAVKLAEQIFDGLQGRKALLIGSGEMAELALLHLKAYGCSDIWIANRTRERAETLAATVGGSVIALDDIPAVVPHVDVVIGSARTEAPLIRQSHIRDLAGKSIFFIDCGLPRNFHPEIASYDGVYLYNLDDLQAVASENIELRKEAARDAELIVDLGVHRFQDWLHRIRREPYLLDFREFMFDLCQEEIKNGLAQSGAFQTAPYVQEQVVERIVERAALGFDRVLTSLLGEDPGTVIGEPGLLAEEEQEYG